ncbi:MAG TPA: N-acetylmuramoyl-L-alanine amidase [Myxococcales bacterium]|nr:N-acetylmuramoyl-L-alanine amidase [Myxococcales bacterium]
MRRWLCGAALAAWAASAGDEPRWPAPGAPLRPAVVELPRDFGKRRVFIDAGHGAEGNAGVASVRCEQEMDFTLRAAEDLARRLEQTGHFTVKVSRKAGEEVSYPKRLREAAGFGAEAIVSLHADARGMAHAWEAAPGTLCWRNDDTPGFSVLYSDRGDADLNAARRRLARAVARRMSAAGLLPYDGRDYPGLYLNDSRQPGAFIDRRYLYVLRKPEVPSVIVETHHFLDLEEAARWQEPRTLEAFAAAVASALGEALGAPPPARWTSTAD